MKKTILYILLSIFLMLPVFANSSFDASISKIESSIYGYDYSNDSSSKRLERLEKTIYGKSLAGDIHKRLKKLSSDISADVIGLEIPPVQDTILAEEQAQEDSNVDYPIVDEIEKHLFNKTYKNRDFHTRIVTIEKKLFGKIYDVDDYSTRMDRIKEKLNLGSTVASSQKSEDFDYYGDGSYYNDEMINSMDLSGTGRSRFSNPFGQKNYTRKYTNYGNTLDDYDSDLNSPENLEDELAKMEYAAFGTEFSNESTQKRLKRLNSVNKAKKSSRKYDSQKFAQHMSTAMEIGAMILMVLAMIL